MRGFFIKFKFAAAVLCLLVMQGVLGTGEQGMRFSRVDAWFSAGNVINVNLYHDVPADQHGSEHFDVWFELHALSEQRTVIPHSTVRHPTTSKAAHQLEFTLWLTWPDIEGSRDAVTINTYTKDQASHHHERRIDNVTKYCDARPPRITGLIWQADERHLCTPLTCPTPFSPPSAAYVIIGKRYALKCEVETEPSQIEWLQNGDHLTGATNEIRVSTREDSAYQCVATTGSARSMSQELHVRQIEFETNIPVHHATLSGNSGSFVKLTCDWSTVTSFEPRDNFEVKWFKLNAKGKRTTVESSDRVFFIEESGTFIILDLKLSDSGVYICNIWSKKHRSEKDILHANLTIQADGGRHRDDSVHEIYGQETEIVTYEGAQHILHCIFNVKSTVRWLLDYHPNYAVHQNNTLTFQSITSDSNGQSVVCETDGASKQFFFTVQVKPNISRSSNMMIHTESESAEIVCNVSGYPIPFIVWYMNGVEKQTGGNSLRLNNLTSADNGEVVCRATNRWGTAIAATSLYVYNRTGIWHTTVSKGAGRITLHCLSSTDLYTPLTLTWDWGARFGLSKDEIKRKYSINILNDSLSVAASTDLKGVNFTCTADNGHSWDSHIFTGHNLIFDLPTTGDNVQGVAEGGEDWRTITVIVLSAVIGLIVILAIIVLALCRKQRKLQKTIKAVKSETQSVITQSRQNSVRNKADFDTPMVFENAVLNSDVKDLYGGAPSMTVYLPDVHEDLRSLTQGLAVTRQRIEKHELIGKGKFGRVFKGVLRDETVISDVTTVAIKVLKYNNDEQDTIPFLREACIMKNFCHVNVLNLVGISFDRDNSPMVVLPYMSRGDLRCYIQKEEIEITVLDLLKLGLQVARGMDYLSSHKFVHRDLACRNCMVDDNNCVKVADFALSRDLFSRDYYSDSPGQHPLPVRWMAPESHAKNVFTMQSDVWTFGVLLWELMTRGLTPYHEVENWQVPGHVMSGVTLLQPEHCTDSVFEVMTSCWYRKPQARSAFSEIVQQIDDIILTASTSITHDTESFYHNIPRPKTDYTAAY